MQVQVSFAFRSLNVLTRNGFQSVVRGGVLLLLLALLGLPAAHMFGNDSSPRAQDGSNPLVAGSDPAVPGNPGNPGPGMGEHVAPLIVNLTAVYESGTCTVTGDIMTGGESAVMPVFFGGAMAGQSVISDPDGSFLLQVITSGPVSGTVTAQAQCAHGYVSPLAATTVVAY